MDYLEQVQHGVDYIEQYLNTDIALAEVARHAGISQWRFQRIFKALTGETLKTYIRSRRFARSLDRLLSTDDRILDIGIDAGFESQQAFTGAFKARFGLTPNAYRKLGDKSLFLKKVEIDREYLRHVAHNVALEPEIVELPALQLTGMRTVFYSVDSEKNNIAERLPQLWDLFLDRIDEVAPSGEVTAYGVVQSSADTELLEYLAAVPSGSGELTPAEMVAVTVPAARYAKFSHRGDPRELDRTVNYVYSTWLVQSGELHSYAADLEFYGDSYIPESESSVMHYAIPLAPKLCRNSGR